MQHSSNQLIGQYFTPERRSVWLYPIRSIQSSIFFESTLATNFALRTPASRRVEQVLRRPIETAPFLRLWVHPDILCTLLITSVSRKQYVIINVLVLVLSPILERMVAKVEARGRWPSEIV
jgi:hypothetical protein